MATCDEHLHVAQLYSLVCLNLCCPGVKAHAMHANNTAISQPRVVPAVDCVRQTASHYNLVHVEYNSDSRLRQSEGWINRKTEGGAAASRPMQCMLTNMPSLSRGMSLLWTDCVRRTACHQQSESMYDTGYTPIWDPNDREQGGAVEG